MSATARNARRMTVTLSAENTRHLLHAARTVRIEPECLLNEWILGDILKAASEPESGFLRDILNNTVYHDAEDRAKAIRNVTLSEKMTGHDFRLADAGLHNAATDGAAGA